MVPLALFLLSCLCASSLSLPAGEQPSNPVGGQWRRAEAVPTGKFVLNPNSRITDAKAQINKALADKTRAEQARAEQARAEKARADKILADKARVEMARAEKVLADKARADRVRAEQARVEQVLVEKARADKIRADRVRAEQTRAEKARADKARAEEARAQQAIAEQARADRIAVEKTRANKIRSGILRINPHKPHHTNPALKQLVAEQQVKQNPVTQHKIAKPDQQIVDQAVPVAAAKRVVRPTEIHDGEAVIMHIPPVPEVESNQQSLDNMVQQYLKQLGDLYRKQQREAELQGLASQGSNGPLVKGVAPQQEFLRQFSPDDVTTRQYYDYFRNLLHAQQYQQELQRAIASGQPYEDYVAAAYWRLLSDYYLGAYNKQTGTKFTQGSFAASFHQMLEEDPELKQAYYRQLFGRSV